MKKKTVTPAAEEALLEAALALAATAEGATDVSGETEASGETEVSGATEASGATALPAEAGGSVPTEGSGDGQEGASPDAGAPADKSDAALLSAFLSALSATERMALMTALSRLADAERLQAREAERAAEEAAFAEMGRAPAFHGIGERRDAIRALCASVDWLGQLPLYERLAAAFYIDRGARFGEPTKEELLSALLSDEELMRELSLRRREARATVAATLPPVGRTAGIGNTPATVKKPPRSLDEATGEAKRFLRFYK